MKVNDMYREFCFNTYKFVKNTYDKGYCDPKEAVNNAIQRILGAGEFVQMAVDADAVEAESIFNFYKEKLENLLTNN
jgi:hypothetical protein